MDVKFGKVKPTNNLFITSSTTPRADENFFASSSNQQWKGNKSEHQNQGNRINDFDSNILENNAYQDMPDEMFKLEHKMGILENSLNKINSEIEALQNLGYAIQISELKDRKQKIEQELLELNKKYSQLGLGAKISGQITTVINFTSGKKIDSFSRIKKFVSKKILAKFSKKFDQNESMKEALEKLSNINSNVDELVKMQIPYGETVKRYEKLTAYLNKANVIHSQITKNVDAISKKNA